MSVTLSLLDNQAVSFHKKLDGMRDDPKVIVATSINPRLLKVVFSSMQFPVQRRGSLLLQFGG